jgi:light-regulated signal transduction histidine kinase (bacteriophytochrome)
LLPPLLPENLNKAACFEAPIDALSHQSLYKLGIVDFDGWRLTLGGDSIVALEHFLMHHPEVNMCIACTDSDEAGEIAAAKIMSLPKEDERFFHVSVDRVASPIGKDWSDTLMEIKRQERIQNMNRSGKTNQSR